jgi:hypothetical protein
MKNIIACIILIAVNGCINKKISKIPPIMTIDSLMKKQEEKQVDSTGSLPNRNASPVNPEPSQTDKTFALSTMNVRGIAMMNIGTNNVFFSLNNKKYELAPADPEDIPITDSSVILTFPEQSDLWRLYRYRYYIIINNENQWEIRQLKKTDN